MHFEFTGKIWYWRGPAPFYFVSMPQDQSDFIKSISNEVTYGWGMIPVTAHIGRTTWTTAMFEKNGRYILPLKVAVRQAEGDLTEGDEIAVRVDVG